MKVIFTTDLHGAKWKYQSLVEVARNHQTEVVINGGDMLPKAGNLFSQGQFITDYLDGHFSIFNEQKIHYLCCLGNDDLRIFDSLFEKVCGKYPFISNIAQRSLIIRDFEFIGMNWVVDYPFRLKDRCRMDTRDYQFQQQFGAGLLSVPNGFEELNDWFAYARALPTIEEELNRLPEPATSNKTAYVIHMPPGGLGLDKCGHGAEVGSRAVYEFLRDRKPLLSLHGHIHESPEYSGKWFARLGDTVCIQPGQRSTFTYVTIDLRTMQFERHVVAG